MKFLMPVVDSFTNSCINMLPDKLSGNKPCSCARQLPFRTAVTGRLFSGWITPEIKNHTH
jgi:hypothetical protein